MKTLLKTGSIALLAIVIALLVYVAISGRRSATFGGPGFAAVDREQIDTIHAELAEFLKANGFQESEGETTGGFEGGVSSKGAIQHWFVREDGWNRRMAVRVDVQDRILHTYVQWEAYGPSSKTRSAEQSAYQVGLGILDWLGTRPEPNEIPKVSMSAMRQDYVDRLTTNKKS
jgi:hypothetical protein